MKRILAIALSALSFAAFGGVGATQIWTSNYVKRVVDSLPSGTGISAEEARRILYGFVEQFFNDAIAGGGGIGGVYADDMTTSSNGITTVYNVASSNGVPVVVRREYRLQASIEYNPPFRGAVVSSSALDAYPVGTFFAITADGRLENRNITADRGVFNIADYGDSAEVNFEGEPFSFDSQAIGSDVQVAKWRVDGSGKSLVGTFTLSPKMLTEEQFRTLTDGGNGTARWSLLDRDVEAMLVLKFYPAAEVASAPSARILRALGDPGTAAVPFRYWGPDMIDYNEVHGDQLTDDDGDGVPDWEWIPSVGYERFEWHNPHNWQADFPIVVTFYDVDDTGKPVTFTKIVPNQHALNAVLAHYEVEIPPRPYNYPQLVKRDKFSCDKYGHVWVRGCKCEVCGITREHDIPDVPETANECGRCRNKLTSMERVGNDYKVIELDEECGYTDTMGNESKHAGWHHEGPEHSGGDTDDPIAFCCCRCGTFSPSLFVLNHKIIKDQYESVEYHDEQTHRFVYVCKRGNCGHEMRKFDWHEVEPTGEGDTSNLEFYDRDLHYAKGTCSICKGQVDTKVGHYWGFYGTDVKHMCKCPCQKDYNGPEGGVDADGIPLVSLHEWTASGIINPHDSSRECRYTCCSRCGAYGALGMGGWFEETEDPGKIHSGCNINDGRRDTANPHTHWCNCSLFEEPHAFSEDTQTCDGGGRLEPPFANNVLGGCGYSRKTSGADEREGEDSTETDPRGGGGTGNEGGDGKGGGTGNGENPPIPNTKDDEDPKSPDDVDDAPPFPPFPPEPPFPPVPPVLPPGGNDTGNSTVVDPNAVTNNWQNVSAPYAPPPGPPPPWTL